MRAAALLALAACGFPRPTDVSPDGGDSGFTGLVQTYVKASNTHNGTEFGEHVALAQDGRTLAIAAIGEDSSATGVDGNQNDLGAPLSGAVYVLVNDRGWQQQAYVKATNTDMGDAFGAVALSADGETLAVGAHFEDSNATTIGGNEADNSAMSAGAVYVYVRSNGVWSRDAYIKPTNAEAGDEFGERLALSGDGNTLVVGAAHEDSAATGIGGNGDDNSLANSGAAYVFVREGATWSQQAYIKPSDPIANGLFGIAVAASGNGDTIAVGSLNAAGGLGAAYVFRRSGLAWSQEAALHAPNPTAGDLFGTALALSATGGTLAIGAPGDDSDATGIDGDQTNNRAPNSGAAYVFEASGTIWKRQAYVKASNTGPNDSFGYRVALAANSLVVTAYLEQSNARGVDGDQTDNSVKDAGAAYVFERAGESWTQRAYVKSTNPDPSDQFGASCAVSANGSIVVVGARFEDGSATGVAPSVIDEAAADSGAVYIYE